jgi:MFS family permease
VPILLAALGAFAVSLDSSVNIGLPAMAASFGVGPAAIRWIIICYVLTYALTAFAAGLLADRLGAGPVFTAGLWLSTVAFAGYGAADSFGGVLALRVLQGVGGGLVYGTAPALVTLSLPRERHGRGLGLMSLGLGAGLGVGPLMGGFLVDAFGWPAVFLARAPVLGALALVAGVGLRSIRAQGPVPRMAASRDLLRPPVLVAAALAFLSNHAQFAVWLLIPFYLVERLGLSPWLGGLFFMLTPLGTAVAAPVSGWVTDRWGPRWPALAGLAVETAGLLMISRFAPETELPEVGLALALVGLGAGIFQVPNLALLMAAFPPAQQGVAGGLAFLSRTLGSAAGVQATATVFEWSLTAGFATAFARAFAAAGAACGLAVMLGLLSPRVPRR